MEKQSKIERREASQEHRCKKRGAAAINAFVNGSTSFRLEPALGGLYYRFDPSTIQEHLDHIQAQAASNGFQSVVEVKMIESGSDRKIPAYDLRLVKGDTDTETR
jgi:hypothetical protein